MSIEIIVDLPNRTRLNYYSNFIPQIGEELYFAHYGLFKVIRVISYISDDSEHNQQMWVNIITERS